MKAILKSTATHVARSLPDRWVDALLLIMEKRMGFDTGSHAAESGEDIVFEVLRKLIPDDLTIFDVGANRGQFAAQAVKSLRESSRNFVINSFEPSKSAFLELRRNLGDNPHVIINNLGLSSQPGKVILYSEASGSGLASLTRRELTHLGIHHGEIEEEVELSTVDQYMQESGVGEIHLLKMDIEGHELEALSGAELAFSQGKIAMCQFEFGGCNIDTRTFFKDFFFYFRDRGFHMFRILPNKKLLKIPRYREFDEKFRTVNYLAIRKDLLRSQNGSYRILP